MFLFPISILRDSVVRQRALPQAMITTKKQIHGFPMLFYIGVGLNN